MLRNAGFLLLTEAIVRVAALTLSIAIARSIGTTGYGQYVYALTYVALFAAFADFGTHRYLTRAVARNRQAASHLLTTVLAAKGVVLVPSLLAALALTALQPPTDRPLLVILLAGGTAQSLAGLLRGLFYGFERMDLDTIGRLVERGVAIGGALLALLIGRGLLGVGVALLVAGVLDLVLVSVLTVRSIVRRVGTASWPAIVLALRGAVPLGLFGLILALYSGLPLYLLKAWQGTAAAGQYGAGATPVLALIPLPVTAAAAALPIFSRLAATDRGALRTTFGLLVQIFFLAGLVVAPGVIIVGPAVVQLVYGPAFNEAGQALRILAIGLLGAFPIQVCVNLLVATGAQRRVLQIDVIALGWQGIIDFLAIPRWGVEGAAWGTASAELLVAALFLGAAFRIAGRPALIPLLRALPATVGMAAVAIPLLRVGLLPAIAGGSMAYSAFFLVFRVMSLADIKAAVALLQRRAD